MTTKIKIDREDEIEIECYSIEDSKTYKAKVVTDAYGRISFQNLN